MYVVICDNVEGEPTIFAPFDSETQAQEWIAGVYAGEATPRRKDDCPNDHYCLEAYTPSVPA